MTFIMNRYDVEDVLNHYARRDDQPNYRRAAIVLGALVNWTDDHSDGWPYWSKPSNAATRLQETLSDWRGRYLAEDRPGDLPRADLVKAVAPIKAFLTRTSGQYDQEHHDSAVALRDDIARLVKEAS